MAKLKLDIKEIKEKIPPEKGYRNIGVYLTSDDNAIVNFGKEIARIVCSKKQFKVKPGKEGYLLLYEGL